MPYCPKCDMEFVEGITVCSDCGGPLLASEEEANALKANQEKEQEMLRQALMEQAARMQAQAASEQAATPKAPARSAGVYVNQQQKYDDLKSSASAFLIVGAGLTLISVLCWAGIIHLPIAASGRILMQSVLTVMGLGSLLICFKSTKSAKNMASGIQEEQTRTKEIVDWFCATYTGEQMDQVILKAEPELSDEELSLRRFDLIQDYLITGKDLPDAAYVEALCEEIYGRIYE